MNIKGDSEAVQQSCSGSIIATSPLLIGVDTNQDIEVLPLNSVGRGNCRGV